MFKVNGQFYIDIELDDNQLEVSGPRQFDLEVVESVDYLLPTIKLDYAPSYPIFHQLKPVTGMESLRIEAGRDKSEKDLETFDYKLLSAKPVSANGQNNRQESPMFRFRGVLSPVQTLRSQRTRSFSGTPSDVVSDIVSPITSSTDIEQTNSNLNRTWVQPDWSDHEMIRYMRKQSVSTEGLGPYRAFFTNTNVFNFKSIDSMYQTPIGENQYLRYAPNADNDTKSKSDDVVSERYTEENLIVSFEYKNDVSMAIQQGALGFKSRQFNWSDGEWNEQRKSIQDENKHRILTNRLLYNQDDNIQDSYSEYRGRTNNQVEPDWYAGNGVIDENLNVSQLNVTLRERLPEVSCGDVVRVDIHDESVEGNKHEVISGRWLVHTKAERIKSAFSTSFKLIRDGLNNPNQGQSQFSSADSVGGRIGGG